LACIRFFPKCFNQSYSLARTGAVVVATGQAASSSIRLHAAVAFLTSILGAVELSVVLLWVLLAAAAPARTAPLAPLHEPLLGYGDEKVANRDTKVWHGATEKGP
jgi:hypothetical protein